MTEAALAIEMSLSTISKAFKSNSGESSIFVKKTIPDYEIVNLIACLFFSRC